MYGLLHACHVDNLLQDISCLQSTTGISCIQFIAGISRLQITTGISCVQFATWISYVQFIETYLSVKKSWVRLKKNLFTYRPRKLFRIWCIRVVVIAYLFVSFLRASFCSAISLLLYWIMSYCNCSIVKKNNKATWIWYVA